MVDGDPVMDEEGNPIPAIDPVFGMYCGGGWTNLLQNSGFKGSTEIPTGWLELIVGSASRTYTDGVATYTSDDTDSFVFSRQDFTVDVDDVLCVELELEITEATTARLSEYLFGNPSIGSYTYYVDGVETASTTVLPVGTYNLKFKSLITVSGTFNFRIGVGASGVKTKGSCKISQPQLTYNNFYPYAESPEDAAITISSAAGSTADNGAWFDMLDGSKLKSCFTGGEMTLGVAKTVDIASSDMTDGDVYNILSSNDTETVPLYFGMDSTGSFIAVSDGTNTVKNYCTWDALDKLFIDLEADGTNSQMRLGVANYTDGDTEFTFSSYGTFQGYFADTGDALRVALNVTGIPDHFLDGLVYGEVMDADKMFKEVAKYAV